MEQKLLESKIFQEFENTTKMFLEFKRNSIPLCAAENVMSQFAKTALTSSAQEKYVMGGVLEYIHDDNFIGGETIYPYYKIIDAQCGKLFKSRYADCRTLTGMNSITTLLMSLLNIGDVIAYSAPDCGGHASIPDICHRLGLVSIELPYDYERMDFDYDAINALIASEKINAILICISDLVNNPQLSKIDQRKSIPIIYDATQTLGLIAGQAIENPFNSFTSSYPFILMGATHKTIPGPSCALIMTQNLELAAQIESKINPMYIRNIQMHQKMSLILTLLELEYFGQAYARKTVFLAQTLANNLFQMGFNVLNKDNNYTNTHQIHITCSYEDMVSFYNNCTYYNITLNFKTKKLFGGSGIRIGTQEISRYQWDENDLLQLSEVLWELYCIPQIYKLPSKNAEIQKAVDILASKKNVGFSFSSAQDIKKLEKLFMD